MADLIQIQTQNFTELQQAFQDAPAQMFRFSRGEMTRFSARFRKKFIKERLSGRPGIKWGTARKVGKNVQSVVSGSSLDTLAVTGTLSRFLRVHEEGAVIQAKAGFLFLSKKTGVKGQGKIFAKVKSVTIPARLGFVTMFKAQAVADLQPRLQKAAVRAVQVAMEQKLKQVTTFLKAI